MRRVPGRDRVRFVVVSLAALVGAAGIALAVVVSAKESRPDRPESADQAHIRATYGNPEATVVSEAANAKECWIFETARFCFDPTSRRLVSRSVPRR